MRLISSLYSIYQKITIYFLIFCLTGPVVAYLSFFYQRLFPDIVKAVGPNMILLWDNPSIDAPDGWTCISCNSGDPFYQRFIRGNSSYGTVAGGSATHDHAPYHSVTVNQTYSTTLGVTGGDRISGASGDHVHTVTVNTGFTGTNLPAYRNLKVIRYNNGTPDTLPAGVIGFFDGNLASGWTGVYNDGRYVRGSNTVNVGTTGGPSTNLHSHTLTFNNTSTVNAATQRVTTGTYENSVTHFHLVSNASTFWLNHEPKYMTVIMGKNTSSSSVPKGLIAMFDSSLIGDWVSLSTQSSDPFYNRFSKPTGSYGSSSDTSTHTHSVSTSTAYGFTGGGSYSNNVGTFFAQGYHDHNIQVNFGTAVDHTPPYWDVIYGKYDPPVIDLSGTVYTNEGSVNIGTSKTVNVRVNGSGSYTAETNSNGYWSIPGITAISGQVITAYLNDETEKATTVMVTNGVGTSNVDLYVNRLIVRHDVGTTIANGNLATGDDNDSDVKYTVSSNNLTVDSGIELHVWAGSTYDPGGIVNTNTTGGSLHLDDNAVAYLDTDNSSIGVDISLDVGSTLNINASTAISGSITTTNTSTLTFSSGSPTITFSNNGAISGTGNLIFNNLTIGAGSTLTTNSNIFVKGNWINNGNFIAGTQTVTFSGNSSSTLDSGCSDFSTCVNKSFYNLILNKTDSSSTNDNLTLNNNHLKVTNSLTLTDGEFIQGTYDVRVEGSSAVSINSSGTWTNTSSGDLYLYGSFNNSGIATFQGGGETCGDTDSILIRGVGATTSWTGSGTFNFNDVDVQSQAGTATINAYSSTNSGGNNSNWIFEACPITSTSNLATAYSFQRKTFYDNVNFRYWKFFQDGSVIKGQYSQDGNEWINGIGATLAENTNDFSLWYSPGSSNIYIAYTSNYDVLVRKGTLSSTDISWGDPYTALNGVSSTDVYNYPAIIQDSLGYIDVIARHNLDPGTTNTATYYFNNYAVGETWTNASYMTDGNTSTYASTNLVAWSQRLNSNTNNGTDLGTISRVLVRVHGYTEGDDRVTLQPIFGSYLGSSYFITLPTGSGNYTSYADITDSAYSPSTWTWTDIQNLDMSVVYFTVGTKRAMNYVSKVEIQVSYSSSNYYIKSSRCATANNPNCTWITTDLSDTANINPNVYGTIVPLTSQDMYAVWENGSAVEGKKYYNGTSSWDTSTTSIGTGITGLTKTLQAVSDSSNNLHLTYINSSNQTVYQKYTTSWQTPIILDSNSGNEYPSISVDVAGSGLYAFWVRNDDIYYRRSCSPYTSWDSPVTVENSGVNKWISSTYQDFSSGKIFLEWTQGSTSPYNIKSTTFTPTSCTANEPPNSPQTPYVNNTNAQTGQTTPVVGLYDHTPAFSAIFDDPNTSNTSSYYQIQVDTDIGFSSPVFWDSTKTSMSSCNENSRCNDVAYSGASLIDGSTYYWRIKFWDNSDTEGSWSQTQQFTMNNHPIVSDIIINNGNPISLWAGTTKPVNITARVIDPDGYSDINIIEGKFYRSGVGETCSNNNNNCYELTNCSKNNCSENACDALCTVNLLFHSDPTSEDGLFPSQYWQAWLQVGDTHTDVGSTFSSSTSSDIQTLMGIDIGSSISFGELFAGENTGSTNIQTTITNVGNVLIDLEISGDNMCVDYPTCSGYKLSPSTEKFSTTAFNYISGGTTLPLIPSYAHVDIGLSKPLTSPSNSSINFHWGISIPSDSEMGLFIGENYITATSGN